MIAMPFLIAVGWAIFIWRSVIALRNSTELDLFENSVEGT